MKIDSIAILDCGGQYTKVIDRRIRELQVRSEIFSISTEAAQLKEYNGIIFSGGPASIWSDSRPPYDPRIFELGIPCLGICYGLHLINTHFGGLVKPGIKQEYGETEILLDPACPLFTDLEPSQKVLMSHGDSVATLAAGFEAAGNSGPIVAAIYNRERKIYAVQFHPEVDLTVEGKKILDNFLKKICGLTGNYRLEDRIETAIAKIRQQVGRAKIIVLVSGGVDSAVSAVLLLKALKPSQIIAIHVDHGLMRKNESTYRSGEGGGVPTM